MHTRNWPSVDSCTEEPTQILDGLLLVGGTIHYDKCMSAELKALVSNKLVLSPTDHERGVVLFARYVDNIYIPTVDIPPHVYIHLVRFPKVFLSGLYKLPLKWE